tara:strand:- start:4520 stop:5119 length:600 start_codon:yes stop_codon:yes gene_type:complete
MNIISDITNFKLSNDSVETILKATLLLVLSVSGNFLAETLGCQSQRILNNMFVKHLLILFMIYFTIDFTQRNAHLANPFVNVLKAIVVWILFHFFTHMDLLPTGIAILLIMVLFFISNYRHYLDEKGKKIGVKNLKNLDASLKNVQQMLFIAIIAVILIGSFIYFIEKKREYKHNFSVFKFIFGLKNCRGYTPKAAKIF